MSNRLLPGPKFQAKIISCRFLVVLLCIFLFTTGLKAQEPILVGTSTRQMIVYAPTGVQQNSPLVISMHGMNQTMTNQRDQTSFQSVAQANGFVLVYPQGLNNTWQLSGTTDTDFILAIIDEMVKRYGIDRDRVYLSGFSMGGMMTYYAANVIADKIAAFAPVSGYLMSGPNAVSSRPIPIIHIHGLDDGYVTYSNAQAHIDAWVKRNGCPTTPVLTKPYSDPLSTKKYYGPGKEKVEVVFISVAGVGHWYSNGTGGVVSSQEIWNFCKKYSLKDGVADFKYASVFEKNPKQIQVELSMSVVKANRYTGFSIKIDGKAVSVDSVVQCDTNKIAVNISQSISKDNAITVSYNNGNVLSTSYGRKMANFTDKLVDNQLIGALPQLIEVTTNVNGNALLVKFNKKMQIPSYDSTSLVLNAQYNGQISIPVQQGSFFNKDSTTLSFPLGKTVYRDYTLSLTYSGSNIASRENALLKTISNFPVNNNSNGLPVQLNSGQLSNDGITLSLVFSKPMVLPSTQSTYLPITVNGKSATTKSYTVSSDTIQFTLSKSVHYGDTVRVNYTQKSITAADNGPLDGFRNFAITNQVTAPVWLAVPGKIEAENFTSKSGMQAETTGDIGGGQNLGYIASWDWAEYAIENDSSNTNYQISFRLAATSTGGMIDFYVDDKYIGRVNAPNTGGWQTYQSVVSNLSLSQGKHYLKVVATVSGFNINYIDIQEIKTGFSNVTNGNVSIYPNPVSNELVINSADFQHNKIEIFDVLGKLLITRATAGEPVLHLPLHFSCGMYFVKISNETQYQLKKFMVAHK
ncbi:carbohydrate-binding protein [Flavobacterium sp. UBA6031]|uniref:carbohydrate-binding protein n=1 Tax=Flavobacterium sp. UBA6031 TaxID=1946551 RepID=UPI0025BA65FE|nr:carbohydrate-binding protein [Flavobacterium sp. UBA6031]